MQMLNIQGVHGMAYFNWLFEQHSAYYLWI